MKRYLLLMLPFALAACTKPAQDATPSATAEPAAAAVVETPAVGCRRHPAGLPLAVD